MLGELPDELFVEITRYLHVFALVALARVSRACWRRLAGAPEQARLFALAARDPQFGWNIVSEYCPDALRPAVARLAAVPPLGQVHAHVRDCWMEGFRFAADCGATDVLCGMAPETPERPRMDPGVAQNTLGLAIRDTVYAALGRGDFAAAIAALSVPAAGPRASIVFGDSREDAQVRMRDGWAVSVVSLSDLLHRSFAECVRKALQLRDPGGMGTVLAADLALDNQELIDYLYGWRGRWWFPTDSAAETFDPYCWRPEMFGDGPADLEVLAAMWRYREGALLPPASELLYRGAKLPAVRFMCETAWRTPLKWEDLGRETPAEVMDYLLTQQLLPLQTPEDAKTMCNWACIADEPQLRLLLRHYDPRSHDALMVKRGYFQWQEEWNHFRYTYCYQLLVDGRAPACAVWRLAVKVAIDASESRSRRETLADLLGERGPRAIPLPALLPDGVASLQSMFAKTSAPARLLSAVVSHPNYRAGRDGLHVLVGLLSSTTSRKRQQGERLVENRWVTPGGMAAALQKKLQKAVGGKAALLVLFVIRSGLGGPGTPAKDRPALAQAVWGACKGFLARTAGGRVSGRQFGHLRKIATALRHLGADVEAHPVLAPPE